MKVAVLIISCVDVQAVKAIRVNHVFIFHLEDDLDSYFCWRYALRRHMEQFGMKEDEIIESRFDFKNYRTCPREG